MAQKNRRFSVAIMWSYRGKTKEHYERCCISPATIANEDHDGDNCVSERGVAGYEFFIHNSLEEAILNAGFNPFKIQFDGLTEEETKKKDDLLSQYTWSPENGMQKKSE